LIENPLLADGGIPLLQKLVVLTLNFDRESFASRWWYTITGYTQIVSHVQTGDLIQLQHCSLHYTNLMAQQIKKFQLTKEKCFKNFFNVFCNLSEIFLPVPSQF
jgi:hypothetical protein